MINTADGLLSSLSVLTPVANMYNICAPMCESKLSSQDAGCDTLKKHRDADRRRSARTPLPFSSHVDNSRPTTMYHTAVIKNECRQHQNDAQWQGKVLEPHQPTAR